MPSIINMKKNISFFDLIVIIFIFAILSSVVWVTYLNAVNTHNAKSAHNNQFYNCFNYRRREIWMLARNKRMDMERYSDSNFVAQHL